MSKKKEYEEIVSPLLEMEQHEVLFQYIVDNSNLPGRMANLTLISVIADWFEEHGPISETWYLKLMEWLEVEADGNNPETVVALVALESLGGIYLNATNQQQQVIEIKLQQALNDTRWRLREIVTESYKRIGIQSYSKLVAMFQKIMKSTLTPLEVRGILATVAHPIILTTEQQKGVSQEILEVSFDYYINFDDTTFSKEEKIVLKKGLSFAPSVIVSANPEEGFAFFHELILLKNKELTSIIKSNLTKKRLSKNFEEEADKLMRLVESLR